jgi:hypothetical protein
MPEPSAMREHVATNASIACAPIVVAAQPERQRFSVSAIWAPSSGNHNRRRRDHRRARGEGALDPHDAGAAAAAATAAAAADLAVVALAAARHADERERTGAAVALRDAFAAVGVAVEHDRRAVGSEPAFRPDAGGAAARAAAVRGIIVTAVGGAALATGLVFGFRARSAFNDAKSICGSGPECASDADTARANALADTARKRGNLSTAFVVGGAVAAVSGVVLWWKVPRERSVEVSAVATPSSAGIVLGGRF